MAVLQGKKEEGKAFSFFFFSEKKNMATKECNRMGKLGFGYVGQGVRVLGVRSDMYGG